MIIRGVSLIWLIVLSSTLHRVVSLNPVSAVCEFSVTEGNKLYNFNLASPISKFPHGVLSEDGFYKVAVNETVIWFQARGSFPGLLKNCVELDLLESSSNTLLCDGMVFNHDPPRCVDCWDCGGPSRCGMTCSALMASNLGGYSICSSIGHTSSIEIKVIDERSPHTGVIVKMSNRGLKLNCSLSVSVLCDLNGVQGPHSLEKIGTCDYTAVLRHPSGCAEIVHVHGKGWGWFGTFFLIVVCLFGAYLLAGAVYRYFSIGVRGIDVIPNLNFWASLPHRTQSLFASLVRRFRGPSEGYRSSYSAVNF